MAENVSRRALFARLASALAAVPLVGRLTAKPTFTISNMRLLPHRCPYCADLPADWVCPATPGIGTGEGKSLRVTKYDW